MNSLQREIEEMTSNNFGLIEFARDIEERWIESHLNTNRKSVFNISHYWESGEVRIVRQCGNKQVGKNTSLTSLYKGNRLLGTLEIRFDIENSKLKVEATC